MSRDDEQSSEVSRLRAVIREVRDRLVTDVVADNEYGPYGSYSVYTFDGDSSYHNLLSLVEREIFDDESVSDG